jgi:hypothetical protein
MLGNDAKLRPGEFSTKDTDVIFNAPVQLPNVTLAPGTYLFRGIPGANTGELSDHVVRVSDRAGAHLFGVFMTVLVTIPNESIPSTNQSVVMFDAPSAGVPQAVKAWFYPDRTMGEEFVYPKSQAIEIAKGNHATVLTPDGRVDENGQLINTRGAPSRGDARLVDPAVASGGALIARALRRQFIQER